MSAKRYMVSRQVQERVGAVTAGFGEARHRPLKGVAVQVRESRKENRMPLVAGARRRRRVSIAAIAPPSIASRTPGVQPSGGSALSA